MQVHKGNNSPTESILIHALQQSRSKVQRRGGGSTLISQISVYTLETAQDFLIKLGIKPLIHLVEISTFSLNNVIVRHTKIMNRADKNWAHI